MGSPETKLQKRPSGLSLQAPSTMDVMRLLRIAEKLKPTLDVKFVCVILDSLVEIYGPMTHGFDKPIASSNAFWKKAIPVSLKKRRGMVLFNDDGHMNFMSIALTREGTWLVQPFARHKEPAEGTGLREVSSLELAALIVEKLDALVERGMFYRTAEEWEGAWSRLPVLRKLLRYAAFVKFIAACRETMEQIIVSAEERIRIARQRVDLGKLFAEALDPLSAGRKTAFLDEYRVERHDKWGMSVMTGTYLSPESLQPFREMFSARQHPPSLSYHEHKHRLTYDSLESCAQRLNTIIEKIQKGRDRNKGSLDPEDYFGDTGARLPFSPEEWERLREFINCIF